MMKRLFALAVLLFAASAATAQHWEFEQVDTVHWAQRTWLRTHPELGLVVGYAGNNGLLRVAWKDTAWNHLDITLDAGEDSALSFDIAPDGRVGVVFSESLWQWGYAERRLDSAWQVAHLPATRGIAAGLTFDSVGRPHLLGGNSVTHDTARVYHFVRADSTWQVDTVAGYHESGWNSCFPAALVHGPDGRIAGLYEYAWDLMTEPGARPIFTNSLFLATLQAGSWQVRLLTSITNGGIGSADIAIGPGDTVHACCGVYRDRWILWYDGEGGEEVSSGYWPGAALAIDTEGHPLIACEGAQQAMTLFSRDTAWFAQEPGVDSVSGLDIMSPAAREALVSYIRDGVWLAHGVDIVGVEESRPAPEVTPSLIPTVVRGVLDLQSAMVLADAAGRRVMALSPGPNDISHLSPGVYFVLTPSPQPSPSKGEGADGRARAEGSRGQGSEGSSRKVVIQR